MEAFNEQGFDETLAEKEQERMQKAQEEVEEEARKVEEKKQRELERNAKRHREQESMRQKEAAAQLEQLMREEKAREAAENARLDALERKPVHYSKDFTQRPALGGGSARNLDSDEMYERYKKSKLVVPGTREGKFESGDQRIPFDASMIP